MPTPLFSTLWAVEDDPNGKVVREVFEAVLDAGGHEQYVARPEEWRSGPLINVPL